MKNYRFIAQEQEHYCVPACLQMVLDRHSLQFDSQEQILADCTDRIREPGTIARYLCSKRYPLHCIDMPVNQSFSREFNSLADHALASGCDIIVGYAWDKLHNTQSRGDHVSLLVNCQRQHPEITLIDPAKAPDGIFHTDLPGLVHAMFEVGDGFHLMHRHWQVLEKIARDYA
jgi:hypothetical protein